MINLEMKVTLIKLLEACVSRRLDGIPKRFEELFQRNNLDYQDKCFLLFAAFEYVREANDMNFVTKNMEVLKQLQEDILSCWDKPGFSLLEDEKEDYYTSIVGMAYGSLYNSNLYLKNQTITQCINQMKNYAYANYTNAGKLVSVRHGKEVTIDLLWVCVPFGLFNPEDLVLVESLKEMNPKKHQAYNALLAWYLTEKSDYKRAKMYLARVDGDCTFANAVRDLVSTKLKLAGILKDTPIFHVPLGNFNRYESQNYERTPWFPKDGDNVTVYAVTWPVRYESEITLSYVTSEGHKEVIIGEFIEDTENYRFNLGAFKGKTTVTYQFHTEGFNSNEFTFQVLSKEVVTDVIVNNDSNSIVELNTNEGNKLYGVVTVVGNQFKFDISKVKPPMIQEGNGEITFVNRGNGAFDILVNEFKLGVEQLYMWTNGNEPFSYGIQIKSSKEEGFYGFGERYNHINQRGNLVDVYVYNQYKDQGIKTYFPMPYFLSSQGYGIYIPTNRYTEFDLCKTKHNFYTIESQMKELSLYCFIGNPKEVVSSFSLLTGKPVMLPEWAFGPWMSSNNWDSDAEVRKQVELTKKYDIPSTVLVIEAWSDEATYYIFNDAVYKENDGGDALCYKDFHFPEWGRWPDPKGLVSYLHENGLKCILWQIPIIKYINSLHHIQKDNDEAYALENGYCATNPDGTPFRMPEGWFTDSLLFDYTSKEATDWWFAKRDYLVKDIEIDGFKTDGGEFVFGDDVCFADGNTGKEMRNEYPKLYIQKNYDYIKEARDGIVFSRAGFTGAAQSPAHWAGDEKSTFDAFKRNLCAGLNAGLSGVPFWGWDLAGFSGEIPSAELFVRSTAMATFCPIMQYHAESKAEFNQDRTPWNIAERREAPYVIEDYRYYAKLRMALIPYIMEQAEISVSTGIPLMRALLLDFPQDSKVWNIFDQYLFGEDLLVAPIVTEGATKRTVYVPRGKWVHIFTKEEFEGPREYTIEANVHEIIVLKKAESKWNFEIENENFKINKEDI
ncbi:glycoside hydrolase family 31 protein [Anaerocolumna aminovalerica]|uniref:Alpha-glucosidase, glycosyl hydrolase family GH31 n=1 Tax=Anaerocolumna aminovalerica TaxID=1527 RepID=A0A1I5GNE2_9FIRM|nr:TIM-barrel domain-containing protein [Anaerocolumna aminovalerica]SFO37457.1 Alpha-glucosidase, glycosyl hydrolase family GH31 [Anaerocolumna aminovalerica]